MPKETKNEFGNVPVYGANGIKRYYKAAYTKEPSIIVGRKGSAGAVNKVYKPCWPLDVTFFIQPSKHLDFEFIFELLKSLSLEKLAKGIKPGLNRNEVYNLPIGLPPFNEQKRIVAKADELMALCDELEARKQQVNKNNIRLNDSSIHKLLTAREPKKFSKHWQRICDNFDLLYSKPENVNKLRQAVLQLAVQGKLVPQNPKDEPASVLIGKIKTKKERLVQEKKIKKPKPLPPIEPNETPYELPNGWEWSRINHIVKVAFTGLERAKRYQSADYQYYYFKMNNIDTKGGCDLSNLTKVNASDKEVEKYKLKNDDFLFNTRNSHELVGKTCVYENRSKECVLFNNNILKIQFMGSLSQRFINLWFISPAGKKLLEKIKSSTTNVSAIYQGKLMTLPVPIPPIEEQSYIESKVDQLMALCDELEASLSQSQTDCDRLMEVAVAEILAA